MTWTFCTCVLIPLTFLYGVLVFCLGQPENGQKYRDCGVDCGCAQSSCCSCVDCGSVGFGAGKSWPGIGVKAGKMGGGVREGMSNVIDVSSGDSVSVGIAVV